MRFIDKWKKFHQNWFQYPNDDGFWYHLRIARQVAGEGHRKRWDNLSYAPEGRRSDSYPPVIHYLLGWSIMIADRLKIKLANYGNVVLLGVFAYLFLGILMAVLYPYPKQLPLLIPALLTTPVIVLRLNWASLRGEILVIPCLPLVVSFFNQPVSIGSVCGMFLLFLYLFFSSKTVLTLFEFGIINTLVFAVSYQQPVRLFYILGMSGAFLFFYIYCRSRNGRIIFPSILQWRMWKAIPVKRLRFPLLKGSFIVSEEELKPKLFELIYLIPSVIPAIAALVFVPNSAVMVSWKIMFVYYMIRLGMGKRYLFFLAVPAGVLAGCWFASYPWAAFIILFWNIFNLLKIRHRDISGIYKALQWVKENRRERTPLIVTWWNHGHIVSGFGGFANLWDSYYPNTQRFLAKEKIFDHIVRRTPEGQEFCRKNNAEFLLLDTFRVKPETGLYPLCCRFNGIDIYYLGGQNETLENRSRTT